MHVSISILSLLDITSSHTMESGADPYDTDTPPDVAYFTTVRSSSPSPSSEGSAPSSPISVWPPSPVSESSSPDSARSASSSSSHDMPRSSSSSPDMARSVSSSSSTMARSPSSSTMPARTASTSPVMAPSSSSQDSSSYETAPVGPVTPRPGPIHTYALPGPDSNSPQNIPSELISLNVAKKLEDSSLPNIEDVLRHCVFIRENSTEANSRFAKFAKSNSIWTIFSNFFSIKYVSFLATSGAQEMQMSVCLSI